MLERQFYRIFAFLSKFPLLKVCSPAKFRAGASLVTSVLIRALKCDTAAEEVAGEDGMECDTAACLGLLKCQRARAGFFSSLQREPSRQWSGTIRELCLLF